MRRRKKDKTLQEKVSASSVHHDALDSSGTGGRSSSSKTSSRDLDASNNSSGGVTISPPQHRRRSLLGGLGSVRDLVEQVLLLAQIGLGMIMAVVQHTERKTQVFFVLTPHCCLLLLLFDQKQVKNSRLLMTPKHIHVLLLYIHTACIQV